MRQDQPRVPVRPCAVEHLVGTPPCKIADQNDRQQPNLTRLVVQRPDRLDLELRMQAVPVELQLLPRRRVGRPFGHAGEPGPLLACRPPLLREPRRRRLVQRRVGGNPADQVDVPRQVPQDALAAVGAVAADDDRPPREQLREPLDQRHGQLGAGAVVRVGRPLLPLLDPGLTLLAFGQPPWRLRYSRTPTGTAQTLVGDQGGLGTSSERITQSCPQLTWTRLRLEISGSWCMPVPKIVSPRLRQRVSSTPASIIVPSG